MYQVIDNNGKVVAKTKNIRLAKIIEKNNDGFVLVKVK